MTRTIRGRRKDGSGRKISKKKKKKNNYNSQNNDNNNNNNINDNNNNNNLEKTELGCWHWLVVLACGGVVQVHVEERLNFNRGTCLDSLGGAILGLTGVLIP